MTAFYEKRRRSLEAKSSGLRAGVINLACDMTLNKSFLMGACLAFFGFLLLSEILLRATVPTGFWYRHFDFSSDMTSLAELQDRIDYAAPEGHRIFLLGDSVLGGSALMEHRIPDAREKTLSHFLTLK